MGEKFFALELHGRRKINPSKKRTYKIIGIVELIIGLFGLIKSSSEMNTFFLAFAIAGISNLIYGLIGKELIKEKNYIK